MPSAHRSVGALAQLVVEAAIAVGDAAPRPFLGSAPACAHLAVASRERLALVVSARGEIAQTAVYQLRCRRLRPGLSNQPPLPQRHMRPPRPNRWISISAYSLRPPVALILQRPPTAARPHRHRPEGSTPPSLPTVGKFACCGPAVGPPGPCASSSAAGLLRYACAAVGATLMRKRSSSTASLGADTAQASGGCPRRRG